MSGFAGVDPALRATGLCWAEDDAAVLKFGAGKNAPKGDARLSCIYDFVLENTRGVEVAVVETAPPHGTGSPALGTAQGAVRAALAKNLIRVYGVMPTSLKRAASGNGKADKADMLAAAPSWLAGIAGREAWDDNQVDAWWLRQCALLAGGRGSVLLCEPKFVLLNP